MKGPWIVLAIGICAVARAASAQHEQPSHDDRSSGDVGHGDAGHSDSGTGDAAGHDSPSESSPSSGGDSGHRGSDDSSGSSDSSPSWSGGGETRSDDSGPPPEARPRDPDSAEPPPTDAQERHPRPQAGPDARFPNPPITEGGIWDAGDYGVTDPRHDPSPFDDDGGDTYSTDPSRKLSQYSIPIRLLVKPDKASVYVDGRYVGIVKQLRGKGTLYLSPGFHVINLVLEGYRTGQAELAVLVGAPEIKVRGKLERIGPE